MGSAPGVDGGAQVASLQLSDDDAWQWGLQLNLMAQGFAGGSLNREKLQRTMQGLYDRFSCDLALSHKDSWLDSERG
jgi:hypothetical protein